MAGLLDYAGLVLLLAIFMTAHAVAVGGVLNTRTRRIAAVLERQPRRAAWVGALNLGFGVAISLPFFALQGATGGDFWALPGLLVLAAVIVLVSIGFAGLSLWVGARLVPEGSSLRQRIIGALALVTGAGLPVAGTVFILPLTLFLSLGALLLSFLMKPLEAESA